MADRADAHVHFFAGGYRGGSFAARPGVQLDELACYADLAREHQVGATLAVGYAGEPWASGNNEHLATLAGQHAWLHPVAYVDPQTLPSLDELQAWRRRRFVGVSIYHLDEPRSAALAGIPEAWWRWLAEHRWLVSVNTRASLARTWEPILAQVPELRVLLSHLALPPRVATPPDRHEAQSALSNVLQLATYPGPCVKLSGFYALTEPGHDYPHRAAWPYVERLLERFGPERLLWGSDFSPHLDWLSFPQTFGLFSHMGFLTDGHRRQIEGLNLLRLLQQVI